MAEVVAGPLIEILITSIQREIALVWVVKTEVRKLSKTLSAIRDVLADAEEKQIKRKEVRDWLMRLKDVAYDAQDVLDDWATDQQSKDRTNVRVRDSFQSLFNNLKRLIYYYKIAKKIKESRERFDGIVREMSEFSLIKKSMDVEGSIVPHKSISSGRETSSTSAEPQIYGRETDKENIVKRLLENINNEHAVSVCPIVGIGGLGKTTLAQFVYNDDRIQKHFDEKIWICVSDDFNVKRLLKEVIEAVTKSPFVLDKLDLVQNAVKEKIRKKRFLLVLDDVWSDKQEEWNSLMSSLIVGAQGSSVIVTTRLVLTSIRGIHLEPYRLGGLSEGDCWALFRTYAFGIGKEEKPSLKKIGEAIIKKCGGLPLAVKALGSLLSFKDEDTQWEEVRDSEIWELEEKEEELGKKSPKILPALRLSYNNLSSRARQCFGYCCLFPKDYVMRKEDLIHLWLANDLLHLRNKEPNEVGKIVFDELKLHSFFQNVEENEESSLITFKIHDLLHDLASSVMKKEHSVFEVEVGMPPNTTINSSIQDDEIKTRHVLLILLPSSESSSVDVSSIHQFFSPHQRHLRTLLLISNLSFDEDSMWPSHFISVISGQKNLRWLRIEKWSGEISLPPSFGDKLKHLRYLSVSGCGISSLYGESFSGMKNLQILDLSRNRSLLTVPDSMGEYMKHLKHLNLSGCYRLSLSAESFTGMKNLQFLDLSRNANLTRMPDSVGNLEHLRHLDLSDNEDLTVLPESLGNLTELQTLKLNGCKELITLPQSTSKLCRLRQLENEGCDGLRGMPSGIGQGLSRLEKLSLWPLVCGGTENNIEELRGLRLLRGSLHIRSEDVAHHFDDVEKQVLTNKTNLSKLRICFELSNYGSDEQVLRILKPPSNIEELEIGWYGEWMFPEWMEKIWSFPRLRSIGLYGMSNVEEWGLNWRHKEGEGEECFPSLQHLKIRSWWNLKALPQELGNLTSLKTLSIRHCYKLVSMPQLQSHLMTSLKKLAISDCPELKFVFHGLRHLTSLQDLLIRECPGVEIPKGELDPLVALRGSSFLNNIDKELIRDQDSTIPETSGKQVLD